VYLIAGSVLVTRRLDEREKGKGEGDDSAIIFP
jgi:hypothetical protein